MKPRLWIVSELFYPEETSTAFILTNIAIRLSEKYDIKVIAGESVYETVEKSSQLPLNIEILHVKGSRIDKNNIFQRIKRAFFLSRRFAKILKSYAKVGDKVFTVTNPAFNILAISKICKKKKLKLVLLVHDVFPENTISAGLLHENSILYYCLLKRFNIAYNCASKIIAIGDDMKSVIQTKLKSKKIPVISIPNWANTDTIESYPIIKKEKIIVKFAGNIGRVQGIKKILDILNNVDNSCLEFVFQGNGACKLLIENFEKENVNYKTSYQRSEEQKVLSECTIGLVSLDSEMFGLGVPSKTYNLMACGRPVLFIGPKDSEVYNLVKQNDIGWAFDINNEKEIVTFLNTISLSEFVSFEEKGKRARKLAEEKFSRDIILNKFFEEV